MKQQLINLENAVAELNEKELNVLEGGISIIPIPFPKPFPFPFPRPLPFPYPGPILTQL